PPWPDRHRRRQRVDHLFQFVQLFQIVAPDHQLPVDDGDAGLRFRGGGLSLFLRRRFLRIFLGRFRHGLRLLGLQRLVRLRLVLLRLDRLLRRFLGGSVFQRFFFVCRLLFGGRRRPGRLLHRFRFLFDRRDFLFDWGFFRLIQQRFVGFLRVVL